MNITVCLADLKPEAWVSGLQRALPDASISVWQPGAPLADHAVVWTPPQQMLNEQTALRGVFNIGAGVDALLKLKMPPGTRIVRVEDAGMAVQMAEYVCHALIRHFREFDGYAADALHQHWGYRAPRLRSQFPVGIMGIGVLGERVAKAVAQFDFPVNGWSRSPKDIAGMRNFAGAAQFDDFLAATRVLVCLLPVTPDTRGIMRRDTLLKLHGGLPGGYVINVARGAHLVEADLIPLLDAGQLAGATLDVFETEPLPAEHPFWRHPKISVTPHASARTLREESIAQIAGKIRAMERGEPVAGMIDSARGY